MLCDFNLLSDVKGLGGDEVVASSVFWGGEGVGSFEDSSEVSNALR